MVRETELWNKYEIEDVLSAPITAEFNAAYGVSIDTRSLAEGDMFLALRGEFMDGHDYLTQAVEKGAALCLVEYIPETIDALTVPCVIVDDCYQALEQLARYARSRSKAKIIAVTGSVGKTTAKDMLYSLLEKQGTAYATQGNLNNHIGLPLSLCRLPKEVQYGVFELGMNHAGEISPLSVLLRPDVALITAIEAVHLEFFNTVDDIVDAKCEIMDGLSPSSAVVIPYGRYEQQMRNHASRRNISRVTSFGEGAADVKLREWQIVPEGIIATAEILYDGQPKGVEIALKGQAKHRLYILLAVLATLDTLGVKVLQAVKDAAQIEPSQGRGKTYQLQQPAQITLMDDSYNAGPASMKGALESLGYQEGRKIAILGEMLELGEKSPVFHAELAAELQKNNIDKAILIGKQMRYLFDALLPTIAKQYYEDYAAFEQGFKDEFVADDVVLVKGSHGSEVWKYAQQLRKLNKV